jgi:hypothetical protein
VDRGLAPVGHGRILLDERAELTQTPGNVWLRRAAAEIRKISGWQDRVTLDQSGRVLHDEADVLGY